MHAQIDEDRRLVRLENEMQHRWNLLRRRRRRVHHACRDRDERRKELLHDERQVILALTIPIPDHISDIEHNTTRHPLT